MFEAFGKHGKDYVRCDEHGLFFVHPEGNYIDLEYPAKLERVPFFARLVATLGYDENDFADALLWFTQWAVWSRREEAVGYTTVEAMNRAAGQPPSFEASPPYHSLTLVSEIAWSRQRSPRTEAI